MELPGFGEAHASPNPRLMVLSALSSDGGRQFEPARLQQTEERRAGRTREAELDRGLLGVTDEEPVAFLCLADAVVARAATAALAPVAAVRPDRGDRPTDLFHDHP